MASLVLTVGGQIVGNALGGPIGALAGGLIGSAIYGRFFAPEAPDQRGPNFADAEITSSAYGRQIPIVWGTMAVGGNIIDASPVRTIPRKQRSGGGKGAPSGPSVTTYTHYADIDVLIAEGEIGSILRIWANGQLIFDGLPGATVARPDWLDFQLYSGSEDQVPDPTFEVLHGSVPAYKGLAHVVFRNFKLDEFGLGESISINFRFLVSGAGSDAVVEETIDSKAIQSEATDINAIIWSPSVDLAIVALDTDASSSTATSTLYAVDPYTREVVWQRERAGGTSEASALNLALGSIPVYFNGLLVNTPNDRLIYTLTHPGTQFEVVEVASAATGKVDIRFELDEEYPPYWLLPVSGMGLDFVYHSQLDLGSGGVKYAEWSNYAVGAPPWTVVPVTDVPGYTFSSSVTPVRSTANWVLWAAEEDASGDVALLVSGGFNRHANDTVSLEIQGTAVFPAMVAVKTMFWDEAEDAWWVFATSADTDWLVVKLTDKLALLGEWDMAEILGVTGAPGWAEMTPGLDQARGAIVFGHSGKYYVVDTTVIEAGAKTYTQPTSVKGGGMYHPPTNRFYTNGSGLNGEILHIVQLGASTGGSETLKSVTDAIMTYPGSRLTASDIDNTALAEIPVAGYTVARGMSRAAALQALMGAYLFDIVPRSGVLTAVLRGAGDSEATLGDDNLGAHVDGSSPPPRLTIDRAGDESLPRRLIVQHINPAHNWEVGSQPALRLASQVGQGTTETVDLPVSLTNDEAAQLADILLHARHIESERYKIAAMPSLRAVVEPGRLVTIEHPDGNVLARCEKADIVDGGVVAGELARYDASVYLSYVVGGTVRNADGSVVSAGTALAIIADTPALRVEDRDFGYYVGAYSYTSAWPGAEVFRAPVTSENYAGAGYVSESATVAVLREISGTLRRYTLDSTTTLRVSQLVGDPLPSESLVDFDADRTANGVLIGAPGRWVLGRYLAANADGDWA